MIKPNVGKAQKEKVSGMILFWELFGRGRWEKRREKERKWGEKRKRRER